MNNNIYNKDYPNWLTQEARETLESGYLLKKGDFLVNGTQLGQDETPRQAFLRMANRAAEILDLPWLAADLFHAFMNGWIGAATPVFSNFGALRGLPISCFLSHLDDTIQSIFSHHLEVSVMLKNGGGTAINMSDVRAKGSPISHGGTSSGLTPWIRGYDQIASAVSQGGVRRGNIAAYVGIEHPDLWSILQNKDQTTGDPRQFIDCNIGVTISDKFIHEMLAGDEEKKRLFAEVIMTRLKTGSPYIVFLDNVNRANPRDYKARGLEVSMSNLCFDGDTKVLLANGAEIPIKILADHYNGFLVHSGTYNEHFHKWFFDANPKKATAFRTGTKNVIEVFLENGSSFICTPDHKLAIDGDIDRWVEACYSYNKTLASGDKVIAIRPLEGERDVYCLNVEDNHNFFIAVGDVQVLVSNCSEIMLYTDDNHSAVCCLSSYNLALFREWENYVYPSGLTVPQLLVFFLDAVLEEFIQKASEIPGLERAVRFCQKSRAIGCGVMGLAYLYQKENLPFDSKEADNLNKYIFEKIQKEAISASKLLGKLYGVPEWCELENRRNSHLIAIAPTRTNSIICGSYSAGVEPMDNNFYVAKEAKTSSVRKNPLLEHLIVKRIESEEQREAIWSKILRNKGSIQHIDNVFTSHEKEVFKTAREINQTAVIRQAADRTPFVCQGQSVNILVDNNVSEEELWKIHLDAWYAGVKSLYYLKGTSLLLQKSAINEPENTLITRSDCVFCGKIKLELKADDIEYKEIDLQVAKDSGVWKEEWKTVPQLFLQGRHIGGYSDYMKYKGYDLETDSECLSCEG